MSCTRRDNIILLAIVLALLAGLIAWAITVPGALAGM